MNTVMNIPVPLKAGNFLSSQGKTSCCSVQMVTIERENENRKCVASALHTSATVMYRPIACSNVALYGTSCSSLCAVPTHSQNEKSLFSLLKQLIFIVAMQCVFWKLQSTAKVPFRCSYLVL